MKREVNYSNWREDLREVVGVPPIEPKTQTKSSRKIEEKEVDNKVVVNPTMAEANEVFKELGGTVLDIQEAEMMSQEEIALHKTRANLDKRIAKEREKSLKKTEVEEQKTTNAFEIVKKSMGKSFIDTEKLPKRRRWSQEHQRNPGKDPYTKKND